MSTVSVLNTDAALSAETIALAEANNAFSGVNTFSVDQYLNSTKKLYLDGGSDTYIYESAADTVNIFTGASSAISIANTLITLGTGRKLVVNTGIQFPAVQAVSTDVNCLDDYEEGTFTPTIVSSGGGAPTYTTNIGTYIKIGQMVNISIYIVLATFGTLAAGTLTVEGLPFAANAANYTGMVIPYWASLTTAVVHLGAYIAPSASIITLKFASAAAATLSDLNKTDLSATTGLMINGTYRATA